MSTYMPSAASIDRKWYVIDAKDKPLGRVAAYAAGILRGKHNPVFVPHVDCGDHVVVLNCDKALLTGKKTEQKRYYKFTGYIGNLKSITYNDLMKKDPKKAMWFAVKGMLPKNTQGRKQLLRLRLVVGASHHFEAQKPQSCEVQSKFNFCKEVQ